MKSGTSTTIEETLDPDDWKEMASFAHKVVDGAVEHIRNVRNRPVWQDMPDEVRQSYKVPFPNDPQPLEKIYRDLDENLFPYPMGNINPKFWMWYMGAGSFTGALGDFLAAIEGSNLGGGNNAAALMDNQVVNWLKGMLGFPETASGTLVSGGTIANTIGLTIARNVMSGIDIRTDGVAAIPQPLCYYASDQVHSCHQKALEQIGLGNKALRKVPSDSSFCMDIDALKRRIAKRVVARLVS